MPVLDQFFANLVPWNIDFRHGKPLVQWIDAPPREHVPVSLRAARQQARASEALPPITTPIDALLEAAARLPEPQVVGIVFHMSRCGSTLIARGVSELADVGVVSEAPATTPILFPISPVSRDERATWLRALVRCYAHRLVGEERIVMKLPSWDVLRVDVVRRAFSSTPWVFAFRSPVEVIASLIARPYPGLDHWERFMGSSSRSGDAVTDWSRAIAEFARAALRSDPAFACFVDHASLPDAIWRRVAPHFGISASDHEIEAIRTLADVDVKRLDARARYVDDSHAKRGSLSPDERARVESLCLGVYHELQSRERAS